MTDQKKIELKTWPVYFQAILDGKKTFEIRGNDRQFSEGDILILKEFIPDSSYMAHPTGKYTGRRIDVKVGYVLSDFLPDYTIMSIALYEPQETQKVVCQCGHSVKEHYEGGGDVTYCEHRDCACKVFVQSPQPQEVSGDLREFLIDWIKSYKEIAERHALAEVPSESTDYLLPIIEQQTREKTLRDYELFLNRNNVFITKDGISVPSRDDFGVNTRCIVVGESTAKYQQELAQLKSGKLKE